MALNTDYSETITKEEVQVPERDTGKLAFVLHNVLSKKECDNFIKESEKKGYELALVNIGYRQVEMTDVRNSSRCIIDSHDYVNILWQRIKDFIPAVFKDRNVVGLNERLRFLRYDPGQYFKPHEDGCYMRENGEKSLITFQLYLNEGFKGGSTTFLGTASEVLPVVPKTGSVLIFQHNIIHEGSLLKKGRKYTVRTEIMYESLRQSNKECEKFASLDLKPTLQQDRKREENKQDSCTK